MNVAQYNEAKLKWLNNLIKRKRREAKMSTELELKLNLQRYVRHLEIIRNFERIKQFELVDYVESRLT